MCMYSVSSPYLKGPLFALFFLLISSLLMCFFFKTSFSSLACSFHLFLQALVVVVFFICSNRLFEHPNQCYFHLCIETFSAIIIFCCVLDIINKFGDGKPSVIEIRNSAFTFMNTLQGNRLII